MLLCPYRRLNKSVRRQNYAKVSKKRLSMCPTKLTRYEDKKMHILFSQYTMPILNKLSSFLPFFSPKEYSQMVLRVKLQSLGNVSSKCKLNKNF